MQAPQLNVDVLATVCEFLSEVSDVLSVSLTCSTAHIFAIRWLLLTRPIRLKSGSSIDRFHSLLFANAPARAPHVRTIHINFGWPSPEANDFIALLNIIASCKNLEHLTLTFERASFEVISDPYFRQAITTIPNLHSLSLRSCSIDVLTLLPQLVRTPLRMVCINYVNVPLTSRFPAALEQFLPRVFAHTLEKLELDKLAVDPDDIQPPINLPMPSIFTIPVFNMTPYPAVRSLSVSSFEGKPLLESLQHLFPALDGTLSLSRLDIRSGEDTYADIRATNQRSQGSDRGDSAVRPWKRINRVICNAPMFYVLGLCCPVRLAMINCIGVKKHTYVADALRENPVPRLKLTLPHERGMFDGLFSPELAETLTHLTLCLLYSNNYRYSPPGQSNAGTNAVPRFQWEAISDLLVTAIQPLHKLTPLRLVVGASVYVHKEASWPFAPWEEYAHSLRGTRFNFEGTATTLARALPSLQNVFLTTGGFLSNWSEDSGGSRWKPYERWYITHGWRVASSGTQRVPDGEQNLVELHGDVAETIIRKEELVLSSLDEAALHLNELWLGPNATTLVCSIA